MIRTMCFQNNDAPVQNPPPEMVAKTLQDPAGFVWVSLENPSDNEILSILQDQFHFHPLAIEDSMSTGYQAPKVDDFGEYVFIIAHAILQDKDFEDLETMELNLYLAQNYLVTCHRNHAMPPVEKIWQQLARDERLYHNGSDFLCHAILDVLVDDYMPVLDNMDDEIDVLEDKVLSRPDPAILDRILNLKHAVMALRRILSPQREVINRLSRDEFPMIDQHSRIYFRDIYDHLVRIQDFTESMRDIVSGMMDIYLSSNSLRLNEVMKALTIVSTIFLPLSFLAGVFGMNFRFFPILDKPWGYAASWLIFIGIAIAMLAFFRRRKWF
jgi:magnesium transporter